jgi:hypothetical protein
MFRAGMKDGPQIQSSKTAAFFQPYFEKKNPLEQCLQLEHMILENTQLPDSRSKSKAVGRQQFQRQLTPLQLLLHIEKWLQEAMQELRIDYMALVRTGNVLLRKIKTRSSYNLARSVRSRVGPIVMIQC